MKESPEENKRAICVLSGGLDSSTCLYIAKEEGYDLYALTFNYGQRHSRELDCAKKVAHSAGVKEHRFVTLPTPQNSALTSDIELPKNRNLEEMSSEIPVSYVPARNTLFLSFALQYAEEVDADAIYTGVTAIDYSGYPDCRPEFIEAFQNLINVATKKTVDGGVIELKAPLLHLYKAEIITKGLDLEVPYELTQSCYAGSYPPCGECDSCILRSRAFVELGIRDPLIPPSQWDAVVNKFSKKD